MKAPGLTFHHRPRCLMDKASAYGAGDSGLESLRGRYLTHNVVPYNTMRHNTGVCVVDGTALSSGFHVPPRTTLACDPFVIIRGIAALTAPRHTTILQSILRRSSSIRSCKFRARYSEYGFIICRFARSVSWVSTRVDVAPLEVARQPSLPQVGEATNATPCFPREIASGARMN